MIEGRRIGPQLKFFADQNFNEDIIREVLNRTETTIDIVLAHDVGMEETPDPEILEWAAQNGRVVLSHDRKTMQGYAYARVIAGLPMPGLFLVVKGQPMGPVVQDILAVAESSFEGEWENRVEYLPLR